MNRSKLALGMLFLGVMLYSLKAEAKVISDIQQHKVDSANASESVNKTIGNLAQQANQQEVALKQGIDALNNKDYQSAIKNFDAVLQIDSKNQYAGVAYYAKGSAHFALEDYDSVISSITQGMQIIKPDERVYFIRAVAYDSKGNKQAALTDYKKAAQLYEAKGDRANNYQQVSKRIRELSGN